MADGNDRSSRELNRESRITPPSRAAALDPLSDVLKSVRLQGALFFLWEVSSPFVTPVPSGDRVAPVLLPGAQQIVSYHAVIEGGCWGGLVDQTPLRLRAGDVLLIPRGDAYVMASSARACRLARIQEGPAIEFFRQMASGELPFVVRDGGEGPDRARVVCGFLGYDVVPFNPIVAGLPELLRLGPPPGTDSDRLPTLIDYAVAEAREPGPGSDGILVRLGELLFVEVLRRCLHELPGLRGGWLAGLGDPMVSRCLALIHRRPAEHWTLDSLAGTVGASRSGLAQRFAARVGEPPIQYLTRWRIQLAARLLGETPFTVAAVASRVGYGSAPALSRAFKRVAGLSPRQWRDGAETSSAASR